MLAPVHSTAKGLCFQTKLPIFYLQLLQKSKLWWKKSVFQLAGKETIYPNTESIPKLVADAKNGANRVWI